MTHASLFSGIGGFDLAAEWCGWENMFHCEWNEFGKRVLAYHFPKATQYGDITKTDFTEWRGKIDVLSGGFPCQPFSTAGLRRGKDDDRYLWPHMLRVIREIQPTWVIGENVAGITSMVQPSEEIEVGGSTHLFNENYVTREEQSFTLEEILQSIEREGYDVQTFIIPACAVGAPHRRDRVWIVAHRYGLSHASDTVSVRWEQGGAVGKWAEKDTSERYNILVQSPGLGKERLAPNTMCKERRGQCECRPEERKSIRCSVEDARKQWEKFPTQPPICGGDDGVPRELDAITFPKWRRESIKAYGNAIVPQIAMMIFSAINEIESNSYEDLH